MIPLNVLEVAVFALVLSGTQPQPFTCVVDGFGGVNCTNEMSASPDDKNNIKFRHGVTVVKEPGGKLSFSNGITTFMDSTFWVQFSNGVSSQRDSRGGFRFNNGYQCKLARKDTAECAKAK